MLYAPQCFCVYSDCVQHVIKSQHRPSRCFSIILLGLYWLKAIWWCIGYNVSSMVIYSVFTKYLEQLASNIGRQEANLSSGKFFIHSSLLIKEIDPSKNFTRFLEKIAPKIGRPVLWLKRISILWWFSPYKPCRYMKPMRR